MHIATVHRDSFTHLIPWWHHTIQTFEMDFTFTTTPTLHFEKTRNAFRNAFGKVVDNKASVHFGFHDMLFARTNS